MSISEHEQALEARVGHVHLALRRAIESEHGADVFRVGANVFHLENWYSSHKLIRLLLKCLGLYQRGVHNSLNIQTRYNLVKLPNLPDSFEGYRLLQLSDLHLDMHPDYPDALAESITGLDYDLCLITGDFRARTSGNYQPTLEAMAHVRPSIKTPVYAILGNHDSIDMVPGLEALDIQLLINQSTAIAKQGSTLWLAGIDDPHYFRLENFEKAAATIPPDGASILLSHSPEPYQRAAQLRFDLMLSGHTHGGQICLPGGMPLITNANAPRNYCAGAWQHGAMQGYTSVGSGSSIVDVRFNCPPEVTIHTLSKR